MTLQSSLGPVDTIIKHINIQIDQQNPRVLSKGDRGSLLPKAVPYAIYHPGEYNFSTLKHLVISSIRRDDLI